MVESAQQWYERVQAAITADGYRISDWGQWPSWPFEGELVPRPLQAPAEEPDRRGAGGVDCHSCRRGAELPPADVLWHDELYYVVWGRGAALPFEAFLMPRAHADLGTLEPRQARRGGELLALIEQAAVETLDVPRIQVARWGDGGEHLHWWLFARPRGMQQLRGTFLSHWGDIVPTRDDDAQRADMVVFARRLTELAGGFGPDDAWQHAAEAFWREVDETRPDAEAARMRALAAEHGLDDATAAFEVGGVHDALDQEAAALAEYERARALGLTGSSLAQLDVQQGSTLRNLGRADEAVGLLAASQADASVGAAREAFLALALHDAGRPGEALRVALEALADHLPRYGRAVRAYAAELTPPTDPAG